MASIQADVEIAIRELGLLDNLRALSSAESKELYADLEKHFADTKGATWIWEHFRFPSVSRQFSDDRGFERLPLIVPNDSDDLLFFPGSDEPVACAYRGTIAAIVATIGNCAGFEYCIAPFGMEWLVCENHHGVLIAVGEPAVSRLRVVDR